MGIDVPPNIVDCQSKPSAEKRVIENGYSYPFKTDRGVVSLCVDEEKIISRALPWYTGPGVQFCDAVLLSCSELEAVPGALLDGALQHGNLKSYGTGWFMSREQLLPGDLKQLCQRSSQPSQSSDGCKTADARSVAANVRFNPDNPESILVLMKTTILSAIGLALLCAIQAQASAAAPSTAFDLQDWKLQIPGPREIKALQNYSSEYFNLNAAGEMCFNLNAAEMGTTPNAKYVRSELRHLPNWKTDGHHQLSAELRVISALKPDKVTMLQIHGITENGGDAPPLLRVAANKGDLVAVIQTGNRRRENETIVLQKGLGSRSVKIDVTVQAERLSIRVDGEEKLSRSLAFWKFPNYFKAGCYPQATEGTAQVMFRKLTAK